MNQRPSERFSIALKFRPLARKCSFSNSLTKFRAIDARQGHNSSCAFQRQHTKIEKSAVFKTSHFVANECRAAMG